MVKMTTPYSSPYCALSSCKILGTNNELFFHKVQKNVYKWQKMAKKGDKNADFRLFLPFFHFWSIFVNFEQKKNQNFKNLFFENMTNLKNWAQICRF